MEGQSKMDQFKNTGKKAAEKISNAASNAGNSLMNLIKKGDTTPKIELSNLEVMKQKREGQVLFFMFLFIGILVFVGLVFISKTFRVYTTLHRLEIYQSNDINPESIFKFDNMEGKKLRDFYIASAYKPYVCYYHKYDYCSLEVFRQVLMTGPRMIELEIFNDNFSIDVEPVVASGTKEWRMAIIYKFFTSTRCFKSNCFNSI